MKERSVHKSGWASHRPTLAPQTAWSKQRNVSRAVREASFRNQFLLRAHSFHLSRTNNRANERFRCGTVANSLITERKNLVLGNWVNGVYKSVSRYA